MVALACPHDTTLHGGQYPYLALRAIVHQIDQYLLLENPRQQVPVNVAPYRSTDPALSN
ncbi:hypothetical protein D3C73_1563980 [compost metagenome]